jgi:hypothetical protein
MPTAQRKNADADAPADAAPVADAPAPVEEAAAESAAAEAPQAEAQPPHPDDLWQHDERVELIFTGESGTIIFPMAALTNGQTVPVPKTLVESYLRTRLFTTPDQA